MNLSYKGLEEVKILKVPAEKAEKEPYLNLINTNLKDGWVLLNISTSAPHEFPGGNTGRINYFVYHFGKFKTDKKEML